MEENIDMNCYPNQDGTKINIGFTFNNITQWIIHALYIHIFYYTVKYIKYIIYYIFIYLFAYIKIILINIILICVALKYVSIIILYT